jgi:hypothetical protein
VTGSRRKAREAAKHVSCFNTSGVAQQVFMDPELNCATAQNRCEDDKEYSYSSPYSSNLPTIRSCLASTACG